MIDVDAFEIQLYQEFDWRWDELNSLKRAIDNEMTAIDRDGLRKALLVVLYSHFEGFCVFVLRHYLTAINSMKLRCIDVNTSVLAGAWGGLFYAVESGDHKNKYFNTKLPDDRRLHRFSRRRDFVAQLEKFRHLAVTIDDESIDTDSNLKAEVLQRNLFLLGLDYEFVDEFADTINRLLGKRNRIAHGEERRGLGQFEYNSYETCVFHICNKLIDFLVDAFKEQRFRKENIEWTL